MADSASSSSEPLNDSLIRDNLSCLGRHPFSANHAYLAFKAPGKNIGDITAVAKFPNLMYINLAENGVEDLSPLSSLPGLIELDVSKNKLRSCLNFTPRHCKSSAAWSTGQKAVGSMLTVADVSENCISDMGDLTPHHYLECLVLRGNIIRKISGLESLHYLQVLDLSYNRINRIEGLSNLCIMELNLEGNFLVDLSGLEELPRLSVLNVSNNRIRSLGPLRKCTALHNVDIRNNQISIIRNVEFLSELRVLHCLDLTGNPCCEKEFYRNRVVYRISILQVLDGTTVSAEENIRAHNIYCSNGGDLEYRQSVFMRLYPGEQFQNFSPYFVDEEMDIPSQDFFNDGLGEVYVPDEIRILAANLVDGVISSKLSEKANQ